MNFTSQKGFTLIEMIVAISLVAMVLTAGIKSFLYFTAEGHLSEAREVIETLLVKINAHALTGKSITAAKYNTTNDSRIESRESREYMVSRYFLYFTRQTDWDKPGEVIYGELQRSTEDVTNNVLAYKLLYLERKEIPYPVWLQSLYFTDTEAGTARQSLEHDLFLFLDPPFGTVSFLPDAQIQVSTRTNNDFTTLSPITEMRDGGFSSEDYYLYLAGHGQQSGVMELALQYKDRHYEEEGSEDSEPSDTAFWLREYVKYDSHNQISHYWQSNSD